MKFYLSSYKLGHHTDQLQAMMPANRRIGCINNARDFTGADPQRVAFNEAEELAQLNALGFATEVLDLKNYFGREEELRQKLDTLGGVWVSGGNTFVLRQAMRLSGFDRIIKDLAERSDFLYAGYSAGICILAKSMDSLHIVDNPNDFPYAGIKETIWEGLGFLDYTFLPHYDSDHPESADIDKTITYCIENKILFKALRDGEVVIINNNDLWNQSKQ